MQHPFSNTIAEVVDAIHTPLQGERVRAGRWLQWASACYMTAGQFGRAFGPQSPVETVQHHRFDLVVWLAASQDASVDRHKARCQHTLIAAPHC